jgi:uncharacterized protein YacL
MDIPSKNILVPLLGIVIGIVLASIANDNIILLQAKNQEEKDHAQLFIGIISFVSTLITAISFFIKLPIKREYVHFIRSISSSVTLTNIIFLSFLPKIFEWMKA